jgi:EAL domain-containing protein (putative c-di-GMP-specific phosphodiesterase class I)
VAVNLAGLLPGDPDFLPVVRATVAESGLPWDRLVLELVETCLADLPPHTLREMNELIAAGVRFAVDDFGTGYSSLSRLTGLPAQIVKLDRGFVRGVATGESDRAVARAIVELTAAIGQTCVAEGVEDADQFAVLRDLGVHAFQGCCSPARCRPRRSPRRCAADRSPPRTARRADTHEIDPLAAVGGSG